MRRFAISIALGFALLTVPTAAIAQDVADLLVNPELYADRQVVITGELIGDFSSRGDGVWVQLNNDAYVDAPLVERGVRGTNTGIGIRMPTSLFDPDWGAAGGYDTQGPIIEATGIFRYQDPGRSGETYLDVASVRLVSAARPLATPMSDWPWWAGAIMAAVATFLLVRWREPTPTGRVLPRG